MKVIDRYRKRTGWLWAAAGVLSLIYFVVARAYSVSFAGFFQAFGLLCIAVGVIKLKVDEKHYPIRVKGMIKLLKISAFIVFISFVIIEGFIFYNGFKKDTGRADYIVILGAGMWGETPSMILSERLQKGLEEVKENPGVKVIVSGGQGPGESITEAEGMKRFLVKHGVDENLIIKEEKSKSTEQNLKFTRELLNNIDSRKVIKIKLITNDFHMFRSKYIAKNNGFIAYGVPAHTFLPLAPDYYVREYFAVIKSFVFDRLLHRDKPIYELKSSAIKAGEKSVKVGLKQVILKKIV